MTIYLSRLLLLVFFLLPLTTFANLSDCEDDFGGSNYIHCTYTTGLNENDFADGRYFKFVGRRNNGKMMRKVICTNNTLTSVIQQSDAKKLLGNLYENISICTDITGTNCQLIHSSKITITEKNGIYFADPKYIEISLAAYANKFPTCDASIIPDQSLIKKKMK